MWYSRKYNRSPMPHVLFFEGGLAIHGTSAIRQLGRPVSQARLEQCLWVWMSCTFVFVELFAHDQDTARRM